MNIGVKIVIQVVVVVGSFSLGLYLVNLTQTTPIKPYWLNSLSYYIGFFLIGMSALYMIMDFFKRMAGKS